MSEIKTVTVGQLKTNCYIVYDDSGKCIIIDPGDDADYIERIVQDLNLTPITIVATHGHFDHLLAVTELKIAYKVPFYLNKKDEFLLKRMKASAKHFLGITVDPAPTVDEYLDEKSMLSVGVSEFRILNTPGHTPGSVSVYSSKEHIAFVGDLMFKNGLVGRTDFSYSDKKDLNDSIKKIISMPDKTMIMSGHGDAFTVEDFKKTSFFNEDQD